MELVNGVLITLVSAVAAYGLVHGGRLAHRRIARSRR
jgi:hypothetical protein